MNDCRFSKKNDENLMLAYLTVMEDKLIDGFPTPNIIEIIKDFAHKCYKY